MSDALGSLMIFFRSTKNEAGTSRPLATVRLLAVTALAAYPAGALLRALGPDALAIDLAGFALIVLSLAAAAMLAGTRLSRLTGEERGRLDEYERGLRAGALENAYQIFTALVLLAVIYIAIASDADLWIPRGYEQWNGLFWGVFLWASVLPTAVLAFRLRDDEDATA